MLSFADLQYADAAGSQLEKSIRAMKTAIRAGTLEKELEAKLNERVTRALEVVDVNIKPNLRSAVVLVEVYRDSVKDPVLSRTTFNRANLEAAIKTLDSNLTIDDEGVIKNQRTSVRYGYVIILAEKPDHTRIDVTKRLFDTLADARSAASSDRG